jgi:hypothetical protein
MATLWAGPVSMHVADLASDGGEVTLVQCTGDGSDGKPTCGQRAQSVTGTFDVCCGFSAGGSLLKRRPDILRQARVLYLADATYTTTQGVQEAAFAEFAGRAKRREGVLFVATASAFANKNFPTGEESLRMVEDAIGGAGGDAHFFYRGTEIKHAEHATLLAPELFDSIVRPFLAGEPPALNGEGEDGTLPFSQGSPGRSCSRGV